MARNLYNEVLKLFKSKNIYIKKKLYYGYVLKKANDLLEDFLSDTVKLVQDGGNNGSN